MKFIFVLYGFQFSSTNGEYTTGGHEDACGPGGGVVDTPLEYVASVVSGW